MPAILSEEWLGQAATRINDDPNFQRVADDFEATVVFGIDGDDTATAFEGGEMEVVGDPDYVTWDFALRAPSGTWEKILAETPPPLHHDLIGVWLQADLTMEGDLRLAIRHLRPLKRLLEHFREVEN